MAIEDRQTPAYTVAILKPTTNHSVEQTLYVARGNVTSLECSWSRTEGDRDMKATLTLDPEDQEAHRLLIAGDQVGDVVVKWDKLRLNQSISSGDWDDETMEEIWRGRLRSVDYDSGRHTLKLKAEGFASLMDDIEVSGYYKHKVDTRTLYKIHEVITDILSVHSLVSATDGPFTSSSVAVGYTPGILEKGVPEYEIDDGTTLREVVEDLAEMAGEGEVRYGCRGRQFFFEGPVDQVHGSNVLYGVEQLPRIDGRSRGSTIKSKVDVSKIANIVRVIGATQADGTRIDETVTDETSKTNYGARRRVFRDDKILTKSQAQAVASSVILSSSRPKMGGSAKIADEATQQTLLNEARTSGSMIGRLALLSDGRKPTTMGFGIESRGGAWVHTSDEQHVLTSEDLADTNGWIDPGNYGFMLDIVFSSGENTTGGDLTCPFWAMFTAIGPTWPGGVQFPVRGWFGMRWVWTNADRDTMTLQFMKHNLLDTSTGVMGVGVGSVDSVDYTKSGTTEFGLHRITVGYNPAQNYQTYGFDVWKDGVSVGNCIPGTALTNDTFRGIAFGSWPGSDDTGLLLDAHPGRIHEVRLWGDYNSSLPGKLSTGQYRRNLQWVSPVAHSLMCWWRPGLRYETAPGTYVNRAKYFVKGAGATAGVAVSQFVETGSTDDDAVIEAPAGVQQAEASGENPRWGRRAGEFSGGASENPLPEWGTYPVVRIEQIKAKLVEETKSDATGSTIRPGGRSGVAVSIKFGDVETGLSRTMGDILGRLDKVEGNV